MLTAEEKEMTRQHSERWKRLGPILDGIRFRELRAMSDDERVRSLTAVQACRFPRTNNDATGWIAWQRGRAKWMKRRDNQNHKGGEK